MKKKIKRSIVLVLSISLLSFGYLTPSFEKVYARYLSSTTTNLTTKVAKWSFKVNSQEQSNLLIELKDTIINNNYSTTKVIPGTKGKIDIELDFSSSEVDTTYKITPNTANNVLPDNLKLYTDAAMTQELTSIEGVVNLADIDDPITTSIYWKWIFTDTDETEDWSDTNIVLELVIDASQRIIEGP